MQSSTVSTLTSLHDPRQAAVLKALAIATVADLAAHPAFRHAELLLGLEKNGSADARLIGAYLKPDPHRNGKSLRSIPVNHLRAISDAEARALREGLKLRTLGELGTWPPFVEATRRVERAARPTFSEPPSAPDALVPTLIGNTHTSTRLSSYVKDRSVTINEQKLVKRTIDDEPPPRDELLKIFTRDAIAFELGYLALVRQQWINAGTHLGEIMHSLALAPGESRNIAVVDWMQRQRSSRQEDTTASERLTSEFLQTRAINEVVTTTAREHLSGMTQVDATTKTSGLGVTGGVGGGAAHADSIVGKGSGSDLAALLGIPFGGSGGKGKGAASDLVSGAGGLGASYVTSNGSVQGTLLSETSGDRTVTGELVQNISDSTVQNSSNVRALMSTVVIEDEQGGRQRSQTRNITNYNHSHALTIQYYEVLQKYLVRTGVASLTPVFFLPFRPLNFTIDFIQDYWSLLRIPLRETAPARFKQYDRVVKDYDPRNNAFDVGGEIVIDSIRITRVRNWSSVAKVKLDDANPSVKLSFPGFNLDDTLTLSIVGSSTYVSYAVLGDEVFEGDSFGSSDGIPIDESVTCRITSEFKQAFRRELKDAIDDAKKTADFNRGFNQLGEGNNKENLKDDVDDGDYTILNKSDGVTLTIELEMTLRDSSGNTEVVSHEHTATYSYNTLHSEIDEELFNVSDVVKTALDTTADINPLDAIQDVTDYFTLHRYGYTRYLLGAIEKEQVIDVIEHLAAAEPHLRVPLSTVIDPNPLGVVENFLIFKLRELTRTPGDGNGIRAVCADYVAGLKADEKTSPKWDKTETVYLPTAGLFGEAILGRSNASEFIDVRRFYDWQDSPIPNAAPSIVAVDLNQNRANGVADGLAPNVEPATLAQVLPTAYPLPTSLDAALQAVQNGSMFTDMSKTSDLAGVLGNLSALASTSAQLAGNLSGEAMSKALDAATALGQQVAAMTKTALESTAASPPKTQTEKGAQINNAEHVANNPLSHGDLSCLDIVRIETGGTNVGPCSGEHSDDSSPPNGNGGGGDDDDPGGDDGGGGDDTEDDPSGGDDGDESAKATVVTLPFRVEVPYPAVRLDAADAAWQVLPQGFKDYVSQFLTLAASWYSSVGFDPDGGLEAAEQALADLALDALGIGELIALKEALDTIGDIVGADALFTGETVDMATGLIATVIQTLQSLVLPSLSGNEWVSGAVRVVVDEGIATASIAQWKNKSIKYGFQTKATPVDGGPWWAAEARSFWMSAETRFTPNQVNTSAQLEDDGSLSVAASGSLPVPLDWVHLAVRQLDKLLAQLSDLLAVPTLADKVAAALGVSDAEAYLADVFTKAFDWLTTNLIQPIQDYFIPEIDFDFSIRIAAMEPDGWEVVVDGVHDNFPRFVWELAGPTSDDLAELYAEPEQLEQSAEGPVALLSVIPTVTGTSRTPVPADWIVDWQAAVEAQ